jgi:F0F1-type ATP synthase delta subunit
MDYNLLQRINDYEELEIFLISLNKYLEDLYEYSLKEKKNLKSQDIVSTLNPTLKVIIESLYGDVLTDEGKMKEVQMKFLDLKNSIKIVTLVFNIEVDSEFKLKLKDFFLKKISKDVLLKYKINSDIGGGIIIQTDKSYFDFSFDSILRDKRDNIVDIINNAKV